MKLQKRKFCSNLPPATHPPLPSAKRFFNAAWQCYFDMKMNKEPCFSILSIIILCLPPRARFHSHLSKPCTLNDQARHCALSKHARHCALRNHARHCALRNHARQCALRNNARHCALSHFSKPCALNDHARHCALSKHASQCTLSDHAKA